jgi:ubiquinol-cytochrome c reductase cytochrome b subunit
MKERLRALAAWLDERTGLLGVVAETARHRVPCDTASWWYVFGSASLVVFVLQVVTGICLALVYAPSANDAWGSLIALDYEIPLGWFLRALHGWGSNLMVALVAVHLIQVVLFGAYKYPRELTWCVGVVLLLLTLGMAFTGQIMRFDQDAYWGLGIGASIAGRTPFVGRELVHLLLGGPIIAGATLSRFFTLHVFVIPGLLMALIALHLLLVLRLGINEWPMPGRIVRRETYRREYETLVAADGVPFFPDAAKRDLVFGGLIVLALVACAALFGPFGPGGQPDPTIIDTEPAPDFFFLWIFAALALLPAYLETPLLLTAPVIGIAALLAVPFVAGTGEKSWRRRPVAVLTIVMAVLTVGTLTSLGVQAPWSPVMNAWSAMPTPPALLEGRSPLELQGALLVQSKQCRNCHSRRSTTWRRGSRTIS